jgi:RNA polymerase subunit RPABC4/transcription elongation factor Spt4
VPADFHRAKLALEDRGLLINAIQPGGSLGTYNALYGFQQSGQLIVRLRELDLVAEVLDEFEIPHLIHQRPIVDRSEPVCPKCRTPLDPQGEETCPACHAIFTWIETESPEVDPTGRPCKGCNYDLTGNTTDRCPECGERIEDDADTLVAAATGESLPWSPESVSPRHPPSFVLRSRAGILIVIGVALAAFTLIVIVLDLDAVVTNPLLGACWLGYLLIVVAVAFLTRRPPQA